MVAKTDEACYGKSASAVHGAEREQGGKRSSHSCVIKDT